MFETKLTDFKANPMYFKDSCLYGTQTPNVGVPIPMLVTVTPSTFSYNFYIPPPNPREHLSVRGGTRKAISHPAFQI